MYFWNNIVIGLKHLGLKLQKMDNKITATKKLHIVQHFLSSHGFGITPINCV